MNDKEDTSMTASVNSGSNTDIVSAEVYQGDISTEDQRKIMNLARRLTADSARFRDRKSVV